MTTTFSVKDPAERIYYGIDFLSVLSTGETISSATPSIRGLVMDDAGSAAMLSGPAIIDGTTVKQMVIGGMAGNAYRLGITVVTSAGQTFIEAGDIAVIERD
jgi:hypothetical protein